MSSAHWSQTSSWACLSTAGIIFWITFAMVLRRVSCGCPPFLGCWIHAAINCLGNRYSGSLASFPIHISCHFAIMFSIEGMLLNSLRICLFVILRASIFHMVTPSIFLMLLMWKLSSRLEASALIAQDSHPHSNVLTGRARYSHTLVPSSMCLFLHRCVSSCIWFVAFWILFLISWMSLRSELMIDPR